MAKTPDTTIGGSRTPDHVEPRSSFEAIRANVLRVFEGVDLQTPGITKVGLITYDVSKRDVGMRAVAHIGALRVAQIDNVDIWGYESKEETAYTLFGDIGHNFNQCVTERDGRSSGMRGGSTRPSDRYEVVKAVEDEMLKPL